MSLIKEIRAKFECTSTNLDEYGEHVFLNAVYANKDGEVNEENKSFSEATPSGSLTMMISNKRAQGFFKKGKSYYLDFTEADE